MCRLYISGGPARHTCMADSSLLNIQPYYFVWRARGHRGGAQLQCRPTAVRQLCVRAELCPGRVFSGLCNHASVDLGLEAVLEPENRPSAAVAGARAAPWWPPAAAPYVHPESTLMTLRTLLLAALRVQASLGASYTLQHLAVEHLEEPSDGVTLLGIDVPRPRLSWVLSPRLPDQRGVAQSKYQLTVATAGAVIWDSGRVSSNITSLVQCCGDAELRSDTAYTCKHLPQSVSAGCIAETSHTLSLARFGRECHELGRPGCCCKRRLWLSHWPVSSRRLAASCLDYTGAGAQPAAQQLSRYPVRCGVCLCVRRGCGLLRAHGQRQARRSRPEVVSRRNQLPLRVRTPATRHHVLTLTAAFDWLSRPT